MLDMKRAREVFDASTDFTVGIEEEFGILDPDSHSLAQRVEELLDAAQGGQVLPDLLAVSANSPFLDGFDSGLASARSQIFTKSFPRCGIPEPFRDFTAYAEHVDFLVRTRSIVEHTQLWWSVRPHHSFGTVELRICDAQTGGDEAFALEGLAVACIAQAALDHDDGLTGPPAPQRIVDENLWRAIRHGLDGRMIDLERLEEFPSAAVPDRLLAWEAPARRVLGIEHVLPAGHGTQRPREAYAGGAAVEEGFAAGGAPTQSPHAGQAGTAV